MSPTYEAGQRFKREYLRLSRAQRRAFNVLRIHRVQGHEGVWELTWALDGRATFSYCPEVRPVEPHVIWRWIGDHSILNP